MNVQNIAPTGRREDSGMTRRHALNRLAAASVVAATAIMMGRSDTIADDASLNEAQKVVRDFGLSHHSGIYDGRHLAEDAVLTDPVGEEHGRQAIADFLNAFYAPIGDLRVTAEKSFGQVSNVAVMYRVEGMHSGPVLGVPPTEALINFRLAVLYEVEDGLIAHIYAFFDLLGLFNQLGGVPGASAS